MHHVGALLAKYIRNVKEKEIAMKKTLRAILALAAMAAAAVVASAAALSHAPPSAHDGGVPQVNNLRKGSSEDAFAKGGDPSCITGTSVHGSQGLGLRDTVNAFPKGDGITSASSANGITKVVDRDMNPIVLHQKTGNVHRLIDSQGQPSLLLKTGCVSPPQAAAPPEDLSPVYI